MLFFWTYYYCIILFILLNREVSQGTYLLTHLLLTSKIPLKLKRVSQKIRPLTHPTYQQNIFHNMRLAL